MMPKATRRIEEEGCRGDGGAMAADELGGAVAPAVALRRDRQAGEVALEVVGERLRRAVAPGRVGAGGHRHDGAEVTAQPPGGARCLLGERDGGGVRLRRTGDGLAGRRRAAGGREGLRLRRQAAGEEEVEQQAETVDVGGGGDLATLQLLGAGEARRHQADAGQLTL